MIGSIAIKYEKPFYAGYHFIYNKIDNINANQKRDEESLFISNLPVFFAPSFNADSTEGNYKVYYYMLKRNAADYKFYQILLNNSQINRNIKVDFPFSIKPHEITYVGRVVLENSCKDVRRYDNFDSDIKKIKKIAKIFPWEDFQISKF